MSATHPPKIQAADSMKEMMSAYYLDAKNAGENGRKIAWINGGGPVELLLAMDVIPVYPENHAAMCGAFKMGVELCEIAEGEGYSRDVCSYARCDIGSALTGKSPIMGLPKPDLLVCCNNTCGMVTKWYEVLSRLFDVPLVFIDAPFIHDEFTKNSHEYIKRQISRALEQMESILEKKFEMDRLKEIITLSSEASRLWGEVLTRCKTTPSPISAFDGFILMGPIVTLRGTREVVDFYSALVDELDDRIANGVAAVPGEKYRLLWDNLPIWFKLRDLSRKFADLEACVVASTYLSGWIADGLDADNPIDSLARVYCSAFINDNLERRAKMMQGIVEDYSVDGIIFHSNRSCRPYSMGQLDVKDMLTRWTGVPGIVVEADMNDERAYSDGPVLNRIEAFIETLQPGRKAFA